MHPLRPRFSGLAIVRWGLIAASVALVALLPVLPCQDLPQHLAYVRILVDYYRNPLFQQRFLLPEQFQPYFTTYYLLALLARALSVEGAVRVMFAAYVVSTHLSFEALSSAVQPGSRREEARPATVLLASFVVWNPVLAMGFLAYMLCLPVFFAGVAAVVRRAHGARGPRSLGWVVGSAALLATLHPVAALCFVLFAILYAAFGWTSDARRAAFDAAAGGIAAHLLWTGLGESGLGSWPTLPWTTAIQAANGLEFITEVFRITWHDPMSKASYALWTILGPYKAPGLLMTAAMMVGAVLFGRAEGNRPVVASAVDPARRQLRRAALTFAAASWLVPWGFQVPTELTFLDLRMMPLAFGTLLATLPREWFARPRAAVALAAASVFVTIHFGIRAITFAREAAAPLALLERAQPRGVLLPVIHGNRSAAFGKQFRLTHFLPMYYTVRYGGITTQFWARYTDHLPIDYRPGADPFAPPDWTPKDLVEAHVRAADHVLLERATGDNGSAAVAASDISEAIIARAASLVAREGQWSLWKPRRR